MTVHIREEYFQVTAAEDLSATTIRYKCITYGGTVAADSKRAAGICRFVANSGYNATVVIEGITKADCASAVSTPGWPLKITTSGWLTACASGDISVARYVGQVATNSGDRIPVAADFKLPPGQWLG